MIRKRSARREPAAGNEGPVTVFIKPSTNFTFIHCSLRITLRRRAAHLVVTNALKPQIDLEVAVAFAKERDGRGILPMYFSGKLYHPSRYRLSARILGSTANAS